MLERLAPEFVLLLELVYSLAGDAQPACRFCQRLNASLLQQWYELPSLRASLTKRRQVISFHAVELLGNVQAAVLAR